MLDKLDLDASQPLPLAGAEATAVAERQRKKEEEKAVKIRTKMNEMQTSRRITASYKQQDSMRISSKERPKGSKDSSGRQVGRQQSKNDFMAPAPGFEGPFDHFFMNEKEIQVVSNVVTEFSTHLIMCVRKKVTDRVV